MTIPEVESRVGDRPVIVAIPELVPSSGIFA